MSEGVRLGIGLSWIFRLILNVVAPPVVQLCTTLPQIFISRFSRCVIVDADNSVLL